MLTALRTGTLDMSVNSQGASSAVLPELAALGLPFVFPNAAAAYKVVDGSRGRLPSQTSAIPEAITRAWATGTTATMRATKATTSRRAAAS